MRTWLLAACAAVAVGVVAPAEVKAQMVCGSRDAFVQKLGNKYNEFPAGIGLSGAGGVVELYTSDSGSWTILFTRPDGETCVMSAGDSWETMPEKARVAAKGRVS